MADDEDPIELVCDKKWLYKGAELPVVLNKPNKNDTKKMAAWILRTAQDTLTSTVLNITENVHVRIYLIVFDLFDVLCFGLCSP